MVATDLTNRFRSAQAEHIEKALEPHGVLTPEAHRRDSLKAHLGSLRLLQEEFVEAGNERVVACLQESIEGVEQAIRFAKGPEAETDS